MNRSDYWERIWTQFKKRKPPETDDKVLLWHPIDKVYTIETAMVARYSALAFEEGRELSLDRMFSHWCYLFPPKRPKDATK